MPRYIGTCFRFYTQMWVEKQTKHLHTEFIVTSHNSGEQMRNSQFLLYCIDPSTEYIKLIISSATNFHPNYLNLKTLV